MALQAAKGDSMEIDKDSWLTAEQETNQVTSDIQTVFRGVGMNDMTIAADKMLTFLEIKGFATREQIQHAMWQYVMSAELDVLLKTMEQA